MRKRKYQEDLIVCLHAFCLFECLFAYKKKNLNAVLTIKKKEKKQRENIAKVMLCSMAIEELSQLLFGICS